MLQLLERGAIRGLSRTLPLALAVIEELERERFGSKRGRPQRRYQEDTAPAA